MPTWLYASQDVSFSFANEKNKATMSGYSENNGYFCGRQYLCNDPTNKFDFYPPNPIFHAEQMSYFSTFDGRDVAFSKRTTPADEVMVRPSRYVF